MSPNPSLEFVLRQGSCGLEHTGLPADAAVAADNLRQDLPVSIE
jgi:hypothetical protein